MLLDRTRFTERSRQDGTLDIAPIDRGAVDGGLLSLAVNLSNLAIARQIVGGGVLAGTHHRTFMSYGGRGTDGLCEDLGSWRSTLKPRPVRIKPRAEVIQDASPTAFGLSKAKTIVRILKMYFI